jgi:hypothetical protein
VPTTVAPIMYKLTRMRAFDFACNTQRTNKYTSVSDPDPDSCRTKLDPKTRNYEEISCLKSLNVLCGDLRGHT